MAVQPRPVRRHVCGAAMAQCFTLRDRDKHAALGIFDLAFELQTRGVNQHAISLEV